MDEYRLAYKATQKATHTQLTIKEGEHYGSININRSSGCRRPVWLWLTFRPHSNGVEQMKMTIQCDNLIDFTTVCAQLARECVQFKATQSDLSIILTGGY